MSKKLLAIVLSSMLAVGAAVTVIVVVARNNNDNPATLTAPSNLTISGNTLTWAEISNASGYLVDIDGATYPVSAEKYSLASLTAPKAYTLKVKAVGDGKNYTAKFIY